MTSTHQAAPMAADDPRHGTYAGCVAHWQAGEQPSQVCPPCCAAGTRQRKRNKYRLHTTGRSALVPIIGSQRRLRALQTLGWSVAGIAAAAGVTGPMLYNVLYARPDARHRHSGEFITVRSAVRIRQVYDALSMTIPTGGRTTAVKSMAARGGWPPPLAWEGYDIDDPDVWPDDWTTTPPPVARTGPAPAHNACLDRAGMLEDCITDGVGISEAVRRTGATRSALQKWCGNKGLHHLYRTLAERENGMRGGSQTVDPRPTTPDDRAA